MKKWLTVTGFAAIALLYSFALSVNCFPVAVHKSGSASSKKEQLVLTSAKSNFYITSGTRLTLSSAEKISSAKTSFQSFYDVGKTSFDVRCCTENYLTVSRQLCVSLQKTVLLFPFHYFW